MTYAELATIRGIGRASAVKLVQRERWQRSSGNDRARTVRVLVPDDWLQPARERPEASGKFPATSTEYGGMLAAIEAAHMRETEALIDQVDAVRTLADQAMSQLADANARGDALHDRLSAAEAAVADEQQRTIALRAAIDELKAEAQQAREAADVAKADAKEAHATAADLRQADAERRARGRLARAWRAWRGE